MLNRLTDRIEQDAEKGEIIIRRYGMWGTSAEVESRGSYFVVKHKGNEIKLKRLVDAEAYLKGLVSGEAK